MMAVDLHNCELLLPSQFFTPQDFDGLSLEKSDSSCSSSSNHNQPINPNASSYLFGSSDSGSEMGSTVGSDQLSSSSTESSEEEEDYIGELTRQMAQYMLQDEDKHEKSWRLDGSPEPILWPQLGSNLDSSVEISREPSPPLTPMLGNFEKMKINEETTRNKQSEDFISTTATIQAFRRNLNTGFQSKKALIDDQIKAIQFNRLKQEQAMKQTEQKPRSNQHQNKNRAFGGFNNGQKVAPNSNNPWNAQQHQPSNQQGGSEMRAVFLDVSGSRKGSGSGGTGVFLPRGMGTTPCESRKKQGCATVLIPARVVHALKLHFEKTGVPSMFNGGFPLEHDACVSGEKNSTSSQQKRQSRTVSALNHQEIGLPQEWTY